MMNDDHATAESWIAKTPGVCGGEPCVRKTRHTVAGLVQWKRMGLADDEILSHHPELTASDLRTAWEYYDQNRDEIDRAIKADEEA